MGLFKFIKIKTRKRVSDIEEIRTNPYKNFKSTNFSGGTLVPFFIFILFLLQNVIYINGIYFDCKDVQKFCFCDQSENEIQCPAEPLESFPISIRVAPLTNIDLSAKLIITCGINESEFQWRLIRGLDFNRTNQNFFITRIEITACPVNEDSLDEFFKYIHLDPLNIIGFSFVTFSSQNISSFPENYFKNMPNLIDLNLKMNRLEQLPHLQHMKKLKTLNLYENYISVINPGFISLNENLKNIQLNKNKLHVLTKDSLPPSTEFLNLANNHLRSVNLAHLANLSWLDLRYNPLDLMDKDTFLQLKNLKVLNVDSSQLREFPILNNLPKLTNVSISHNELLGASLSLNEEEAEEKATEKSTSLGKSEDIDTEKEGKLIVDNVPELAGLILSKDGLKMLPDLKNLPNLKSIILSRNQIKTIPKNAFSNLPTLTVIDLSYNSIDNFNDINAPLLNELYLQNNSISSLNSTELRQLRNLKILNLSKNKIQWVHNNAFETLPNLEELDLSFNQISFIEPEKGPSISQFVMDYDGFGYGFSQSPLKSCTRMKKLNLKNNLISHIFQDWSYIFSQLSLLNLANNKIESLEANDLNFISNNLEIDISNNEISTINMDNWDIYLGESSDNKKIIVKLGGNPLHCDCKIYPLKKFKHPNFNLLTNELKCKNGEKQDLKDKKIDNVMDYELICPISDKEGCPSICECKKRPSDVTILVDCSDKNVTISSNEENYIFSSIDNLLNRSSRYNFEVNLAGNEITKIYAKDIENLGNTKSLYLDLSRNYLTSLNFLEELNNSNIIYNFKNNPFSCNDCNFHKIIRLKYQQIKNITCVTGDDEEKDPLFESAELCLTEQILSAELRALIICLGVLAIVLIILIGLYIRHGWAIRAYLYSKGYGCLFLDDDLEEEGEKIYDAFVSFSHLDEEWVLEELVYRLEEKEGFKLCLHFRDWIPGDWIPDQIVRSVDKSRRTVVILSKNFVESIWSRLEFKAAHSQALNEKENRLILVLMGDDLTDDDVKDEDLKVYMKMNTYLKWNDPWFWHKLKYALPHKKGQNPTENDIKRLQREKAIQLDKMRAQMDK